MMSESCDCVISLHCHRCSSSVQIDYCVHVARDSTYSTRMRMPELPEVETVVRDLRPLLVGKTPGRDPNQPQAIADEMVEIVGAKANRQSSQSDSPARQMDPDRFGARRTFCRASRHDRTIDRRCTVGRCRESRASHRRFGQRRRAAALSRHSAVRLRDAVSRRNRLGRFAAGPTWPRAFRV